jgi:hypothetical protein
MNDINVEVESGKSKRLLTAGKVCNNDIVVTAKGGGDNAEYISLIDGTMTDFVAPVGTSKIKTVLFYKDKTIATADLRNVTDFIGNSAFENSTLSSVKMPTFLKIGFGSSGFAESALIEFEYLGENILYSGTQSLFSKCLSLKKINMPNVKISGTGRLVNGCSVLEEIYVGKITNSFQVGSGTTYGHLIKVECLVGLIQNLVKSTTAKTLTIGTANVEKIEGLYCRITDDTTDTLTMELCEETDEGAMPLEEYWTMKGWSVV